MTLRDNLAAVLEKIREAINAIDAAEAAPAEAAPAEEAAEPVTEFGTVEVLAEDAPADTEPPVHHGGPASV